MKSICLLYQVFGLGDLFQSAPIIFTIVLCRKTKEADRGVSTPESASSKMNARIKISMFVKYARGIPSVCLLPVKPGSPECFLVNVGRKVSDGLQGFTGIKGEALHFLCGRRQ